MITMVIATLVALAFTHGEVRIATLVALAFTVGIVRLRESALYLACPELVVCLDCHVLGGELFHAGGLRFHDDEYGDLDYCWIVGGENCSSLRLHQLHLSLLSVVSVWTI